VDKPWFAHYENGIPHSVDYPDVTLSQALQDVVRAYPKAPALSLVLRYLGPIGVGARLTFRQMDEQVRRFTAALAALGVKKGDRVGIVLPNLPQAVIAFYGATRLGAVVVNTNPLYTGRELEHQFADSGTETVVILSGMYGKLREVQAHTPVKDVILADVTDYVAPPLNAVVDRTLKRQGMKVEVAGGEGIYHWKQLLAAHGEPPPPVDLSPQDVALFQYTGGTTGVPKAAQLTHANLMAEVVQLRHWIPTLKSGEQRFLGAIPLFHVYGMTVCMLLVSYMASELVIVPNPRDTEGVMKTIDREKITMFPGVPAMYTAIINHPHAQRYDLRSVKACISGSAPLPMEVQIKFGEITGGRLVEGYGLTEAAPVTHCNPVFGERRAGSIGLPLPGVDARIVDFETLQDCPPGTPGELWVRGPQVMTGYYKQPDETVKTMTAEGWLRTGDIARMDEDGYFYIVDRLKDIIIVGGFNVVPREVEEVLFEYPAVQDAAVAGVPSPRSGEVVKAYVVLKEGQKATAEEIIAFCRQRLTGYKVPKQVEFRSELPKTMTGKVLRRALAEEEEKRLA
jgi:long-chain acyl-CoA synthetase